MTTGSFLSGCRLSIARDRKSETIETDLGTVSFKTSAGYGVVRKKVEYEDLARIARENGLGLSEARRLVEK